VLQLLFVALHANKITASHTRRFGVGYCVVLRLCYFVVAIVNESERAHVGWFAKEAKAVFYFHNIQYNLILNL